MALIYETDSVTFDGHCAIDEAEALLAWVQGAAARGVRPSFDLSKCTHVHAALVQIVMRAAGRVSTPETGLLSLCLRSVQARGLNMGNGNEEDTAGR